MEEEGERRSMKKNIVWVCEKCGLKYGRRKPGVATWHEDICDVCGKKKMVTEPRDFSYLIDDMKGEKHELAKEI